MSIREFLTKKEIKRLDTSKKISSKNKKINFIESLKINSIEKRKNSKIEILICEGDGLGIQNKISY